MATQVSTRDDRNGLLRGLMKTALERMLNTELVVHLGRRALSATAAEEPLGVLPATGAATTTPTPKNRRHGHSQQTVSGDMGDLTSPTPRDRDGTFEPQLIGKHQRRLERLR